MNILTVPWIDFFEAEGLPVPPVPKLLADTLRAWGGNGFATPGWPESTDLEALAIDWLANPLTPRAWVGLGGHGLVSGAVRVCLCTPQAAFFLQRRWSQAHDDGPDCARRIDGAFQLLARILAALERARAAGSLPPTERLLLIDDDFDVQRWGWVPAGADDLAALSTDPLAYIRILARLER